MRDLDRSFVVEFERQVRPADGTGEWRAFGAPIRVPCLGRRTGYALSGSEQSYVADYNVEIAQSSSVADPVVQSVFDGTQVIASVHPTDESCRVRFALVDSALNHFRQVAAAAEGVGSIECADVVGTEFDRVVMIKPGETMELGEGPIRFLEGGQFRSRLRLKLTEIK